MNEHKIIILTGLLFLFSGCGSVRYSAITKEEEIIFIGDEKEIKIGRSVDKRVRKTFDISDDNILRQRVEKIGAKIALVCDRTQIPYHFEVVTQKEEKSKKSKKEKPNAFAVPGGFVYINKALIELIGDNDDELACILAHEVGHITARHSIKRLQALYGYNILKIFSVTAARGSGWDARMDVAIFKLFMSYSREDELLADKLAVKYTKAAGYDPEAMISVLKKLHEFNKSEPIRRYSHFRTHPYIPERIRGIKEKVRGEIDFIDVINTSK